MLVCVTDGVCFCKVVARGVIHGGPSNGRVQIITTKMRWKTLYWGLTTRRFCLRHTYVMCDVRLDGSKARTDSSLLCGLPFPSSSMVAKVVEKGMGRQMAGEILLPLMRVNIIFVTRFRFLIAHFRYLPSSCPRTRDSARLCSIATSLFVACYLSDGGRLTGKVQSIEDKDRKPNLPSRTGGSQIPSPNQNIVLWKPG